MYCSNCGKKNKDDANVCINCGSKLEKEDLFKIDEDLFKIDSSEFEDLKEIKKEKTKANNIEINKEKEGITETKKEELNKNYYDEEKKEKIKNNYIPPRPEERKDLVQSRYYFNKYSHVIDLDASNRSFIAAIGIIFIFFAFIIAFFTLMKSLVKGEFIPILIMFSFFLFVIAFITFGLIKTTLDNKKAKNALKIGKFIEAKIIDINSRVIRNGAISKINHIIVFEYNLNGVKNLTSQKVSESLALELSIGEMIKVKASDSIAVIDEKNYQL